MIADSERDIPGTEPLPVWDSSAVLSYQGTVISAGAGGAKPGECEPGPGAEHLLPAAQLTVLPSLHPSKLHLDDVLIPLL